jgi:hypothetical protein
VTWYFPTRAVPATNSGLRMIQYSNLRQIEDLAEQHPVFLFTYSTQDARGAYSLVVKAETGPPHGRPRYDAAAEVVAAISPNSVSESLTDEEFLSLEAIAVSPKATMLLREWVNHAKAGRAFFIKMRYRKRFAELKNAEFGKGIAEEQKEELLMVMGQLSENATFWKSLGEVVATDFFIGNGDRITWVGPKGRSAFTEPWQHISQERQIWQREKILAPRFLQHFRRRSGQPDDPRYQGVAGAVRTVPSRGMACHTVRTECRRENPPIRSECRHFR